jgi:hypothetical protein
MRLVGCATRIVLVAALGLAAPGLSAQSQDEDILQGPEGGTEQAPPARTDSDEELDEQVFYSGLGVGRVESDFQNLGEAINLEIVLGFRIPTVKWFGIEIDIGQTIIPGENKTEEQSSFGGGGTECLIDPSPLDPDGFPNGCTPSGSGGSPQTVSQDPDELAMQALGISAAVKTTGRFYFLGKLGYRYVATSIDELNENRSGTGFGVGAGYRWGRGLSGVELSYKELSEDLDSLSLVFFARFNRP